MTEILLGPMGRMGPMARSARPASSGWPTRNSLNNGAIVGALAVNSAMVSIKNAISGPTVVNNGSAGVIATVNWFTQI